MITVFNSHTYIGSHGIFLANVKCVKTLLASLNC